MSNIILYLDEHTGEAYDREDNFFHSVYNECPTYYTAFEVHQPKALEQFDLNEYITPDHRLEIQDHKRRIYFTNTHEAFVHMIPKVYDAIKKFNLPYEQVVIVSELAVIPSKITEYCNRKGLPEIKSVWTRRFEHDVRKQRRMQIQEDASYIKLPNTLTDKTYDKKYLNFNRRWRFHRPLLTAMLYCEDLLKFGHVSLGRADDDQGWEPFDRQLNGFHRMKVLDFELREKLRARKDEIKALPDMYLDTKDLVTNRAGLDLKDHYLYEETYFSLVSETNYYETDDEAYPGFDTGVFFSEKIFKCIAYRHPFVVVSNHGFLRALKTIGYKTFSPWIDESYDDEPDPTKRMTMIVAEVKRLSNLDTTELKDFLTHCKEVCDHNFHLFLGKQKFYTQMWLEKICRVEVRRTGSRMDLPAIAEQINQEIAQGAIKVEINLSSEGVFSKFYKSPTKFEWSTDLHTDDEKREFFHDINLTELHDTHKLLDMIDLPAEAVKFNCASYNIDLIYGRYREIVKPPNPIKVGVKNLFEISLGDKNYDTVNRPMIFPPPEPTQWQDKKKFLLYNRMPHPHRLVLVAMLHEAGLLDQGIVSCHIHGKEDRELDSIILPGKEPFYDNIKNTFAENPDLLPITLDLKTDDSGMAENYTLINLQHFEDTFFSVITETEFYNRRNMCYGDIWNMYFTEKTFRAIRMKHPFVLVNMPNTLKCLQDIGFRTFSYWINESYDSVISEEERLKSITKEIQRLCNLPQSELRDMISDMQDVLDYNHDLLVSKSNNQRFQ